MTATPHGDPRVRPAVRRLAIVAFVVLLPLATHTIWDYVEIRRLIREIEAIRERGEPLREIDARGYESVGAAAGTAGSYYAAAVMLGQPNPALNSPELDSIRDWIDGAPGMLRPAPGVTERLTMIIEDRREPLALADTGAKLPFNGFPFSYSYNPINLSNVARLISARTVGMSLLNEGDTAVDSAISALRMRRAIRGSPWERFAPHETAAILSLSRPSTEALRRLQSAIESEDRPEWSAEVLIRERARDIGLLWSRYYGSDPRDPRRYSPRTRSLLETVLRPRITHQLVQMLQVWAELIDAVRVPWPQKVQASAEVIRKYPPEQVSGRPSSIRRLTSSFVSIPLPSFNEVVRPDTLIVDRASRVAIAIELFRRDHAAALPATLSKLVPKYISELPQDPLTGTALLYRVNGEAYTVYSVGMDQKDDGGTLLRETPRGSARRFIAGPDLGVRVLID